MPRRILPGHEGLTNKKTAETLKSLAVHLTLHHVNVRILPADPRTSASHPPGIRFAFTLNGKGSQAISPDETATLRPAGNLPCSISRISR